MESTWFVIASPAPFHLGQAFSASHGVPCLIEKPVGTGYESQDDWDELSRYSLLTPISVGMSSYDPCALYKGYSQKL